MKTALAGGLAAILTLASVGVAVAQPYFWHGHHYHHRAMGPHHHWRYW